MAMIDFMQGVHCILPPPSGSGISAGPTGHGFRRSATVRNKSLTNNEFGMRRVPTIADFNNLLEGNSLNLSQTNLSHLRPMADVPLRRGSNPNVTTERKGSVSRDEALAVDLLRLLTVTKMANTPREGQQEREGENGRAASKTDNSK